MTALRGTLLLAMDASARSYQDAYLAIFHKDASPSLNGYLLPKVVRERVGAMGLVLAVKLLVHAGQGRPHDGKGD